MRPLANSKTNGFSLIEVLITLVILMIGLLGLVGLQSAAITTQTEAYQRSQAITLVKDMADRLNANRATAATYVTGTPLGTGAAAADCAGVPLGQALDACEWHNALLGAAETKGGTNVGTMTGARGCIYNTVAGAVPQFLIAVAWQGFNRTAAPPGVDCGAGEYGSEELRRVVTLTVTIGNLAAP